MTVTSDVRAAVGMGTLMGIPIGWDGYRDCDESLWACGNSVGICDWLKIKRKCVKYA